MKIALTVFHFGGRRGGAERAAANLAQGLLGEGHEVHVHSHTFEGGANGLRHHPVPATTFASALKSRSFARALQASLQGETYDIIQSFTRTYGCDVYRVGGGPHDVYLESVRPNRSGLSRLLERVNPKNRITRELEARSFAPDAYRRVVAVSRRVRDNVIRRLNVPEDRVTVIHNGVDIDRFRPDARVRDEVRGELSAGRDACVALFAATGWRTKGLRFALEALGRLPKHAFLWVAGRGTPLPERPAVSGRVRWLGSRPDMERLYAGADLLVHPTLFDPFPNSCLEAMSCGLPVVTTEAAGVSDLIETGRNGMVVSDGADVDALTQRWEELLDPRTRARISVEARRTAETRSLGRFTADFLSVYEEVRREKSTA